MENNPTENRPGAPQADFAAHLFFYGTVGPARAAVSGTHCKEGRRPPPRDGVGTAALRLRRGDCAICGWRWRPLGCFARCGGREFRPVRGATRGSASGLRDLGNAPPVGNRCRRGILCQSKAQLLAILDVWQEAGPRLWRKRPGDTRRHTGGKLPHRKNRVKL